MHHAFRPPLPRVMAHRNRTYRDVVTRLMREVLTLDATKIRESHLGGLLAHGVSPSSTESCSFTSLPWRASCLKVPLAEIGATFGAPAEADGTVRQHHLAVLIEGYGLPFRIVRLSELAVEVRSTHVAVRYQHCLTAGQRVLL